MVLVEHPRSARGLRRRRSDNADNVSTQLPAPEDATLCPLGALELVDAVFVMTGIRHPVVVENR